MSSSLNHFVAAGLVAAVAGLVAGCGDNKPNEPTDPIDPSAAAGYRGYAAVEDDLRIKFLAPDAAFELFTYLGDDGEQLSRLVGRPDGFGVNFDNHNNKPNGMNILVWRMMLSRFASDLAATCPGSGITKINTLELNSRAQQIVGALCSWPTVTDDALGNAWDLMVGKLAPKESREAFIELGHHADLTGRRGDDALPSLLLAALVHPSFLLEQ